MYFNVLFVWQEWRFHEVPQQKVLRINIKCVAGDLGNSVPVTHLHRLVRHQLQQRTSLVEVIDCLAKVFISLPFLQSLRQLATPAHKTTQHGHQCIAIVTNIIYIHTYLYIYIYMTCVCVCVCYQGLRAANVG